MGNTANKPIDVKEVVSFTENPPLDVVDKSLSDDEIRKRLAQEGVVVHDDTSRSDLEKALAITTMNGFWRKHPEAHPNYGRVKNWLMVHNKYRTYLNDLAKFDKKIMAFPAFEKWCRKLEGHSKFEDEELFKFFHDHICKQQPDLQESLETLEQQHEQAKSQEAELRKMFQENDEWQTSLQIYVDDMLKHMETEEIAVINPWLHLTDEEYQTYRQYLSWKYAAMY